MPRIRKGYAEGRWGQIHYKECGPVGDHEGRPLLLLHQSPTDSVQFARAMRPLAVRGIRAIAIDLPGFGGSDTPPAPPSVADYAHIVPAVLDHLGISTASILGHHTGAVIATGPLAMASTVPSATWLLVVIAPQRHVPPRRYH